MPRHSYSYCCHWCCCCCCFLLDLIRYVLFLLLLAYQIMFVYNQWYGIFVFFCVGCSNAKMCLILNLSFGIGVSQHFTIFVFLLVSIRTHTSTSTSTPLPCACKTFVCGDDGYKFMHVENTLVKWIMHNTNIFNMNSNTKKGEKTTMTMYLWAKKRQERCQTAHNVYHIRLAYRN